MLYMYMGFKNQYWTHCFYSSHIQHIGFPTIRYLYNKQYGWELLTLNEIEYPNKKALCWIFGSIKFVDGGTGHLCQCWSSHGWVHLLFNCGHTFHKPRLCNNYVQWSWMVSIRACVWLLGHVLVRYVSMSIINIRTFHTTPMILKVLGSDQPLAYVQ